MILLPNPVIDKTKKPAKPDTKMPVALRLLKNAFNFLIFIF